MLQDVVAVMLVRIPASSLASLQSLRLRSSCVMAVMLSTSGP